MTKKQEQLLNNYEYALRQGAKTELYQIYGHYSRAKQNALNYCKELQSRLKGYDATIVGHSAHFFSYAFKYVEVDQETGEIFDCLCYCTHANDYKFRII